MLVHSLFILTNQYLIINAHKNLFLSIRNKSKGFRNNTLIFILKIENIYLIFFIFVTDLNTKSNIIAALSKGDSVSQDGK